MGIPEGNALLGLECDYAALLPGQRPPLPDWFMLLDYCGDLHVDFFKLAGIECREPYVSTVLQWTALRRQAKAAAEKEYQAHQAKKK